MNYYLAIDLGASSGRHIVGYKLNGRVVLDEVYRFKNGVKQENNHLIWDIDYLFEEVKKGIKQAFKKYPNIKSLGIDTWGVDYVLLNRDKEVIYPCYSYRDSRTNKIINQVHSFIPFEKLYALTGIQFQPFNTIYQLYLDKVEGRLENAFHFLMIPEYLAYKLTGNIKKEYTNQTTTGLINGNTKTYDKEIIKTLGLKEELFEPIFNAGIKVGQLTKNLEQELGGKLDVVLVPSHDTASAINGIDMDGNQPYISSGTWSLLGLKVEKMINTEEARKANYSNEGGVNYLRFQKNIMGMWLVQSLQKELCPSKDFVTIVKEAKESSFKEIVNINDPIFLSPNSMRQAFDSCFEKLNKKPASELDYFSSAYYSLAFSYKEALDELKNITKKGFNALYIVGGGAKNDFLNQLTEEMTALKVIPLPIEATALGNIKSQMINDKN